MFCHTPELCDKQPCFRTRPAWSPSKSDLKAMLFLHRTVTTSSTCTAPGDLSVRPHKSGSTCGANHSPQSCCWTQGSSLPPHLILCPPLGSLCDLPCSLVTLQFLTTSPTFRLKINLSSLEIPGPNYLKRLPCCSLPQPTNHKWTSFVNHRNF